MTSLKTKSNLSNYTSASSSTARIAVLDKMHSSSKLLPLDFIEQVFCFDLVAAEKAALLHVIDLSSSGVKGESFLVEAMQNSSQEIALAAFEAWFVNSSRKRSQEVAKLAHDEHTPQRLVYKIIEQCEHLGSEKILKYFADQHVLSGLSATVQAEILFKSVLCGFSHPVFLDLAKTFLSSRSASDRQILAASVYCLDFDKAHLETLDYSQVATDPLVFVLKLVKESARKNKLSPIKLVNEELQRATTETSNFKTKRENPDIGNEPSSELITTHANQKWLRYFVNSCLHQKKDFIPEVQKGLAQDEFFKLLCEVWDDPQEHLLDSMAVLARKIDPIYKIPYLRCLGRFRGCDKAVLKLLDFTRSTDEAELRCVARSLAEINSQHSAQELLAMLTRPNTSVTLRVEIATLLSQLRLDTLQSELRTALNDLPDSSDQASAAYEIRELLSTKLIPETASIVVVAKQKGAPDVDFKAIDRWLSSQIRTFDLLSSEIKRALRTARFFHERIVTDSGTEVMDLSPLVDMQYKALELLFRENFEDLCTKALQNGSIQRRLDVIGYARPIESQMDRFENYLSRLPIIHTIPFFSKFKLRKMLRAICVYRPGKRFTLDGIKAFALFFLVFGRKEDDHGLASMIPIGFTTDTELFEFVKSLHIFQDMRNRAAHEGFQPQDSADLSSIWKQTSTIIDSAAAISSSWSATTRRSA